MAGKEKIGVTTARGSFSEEVAGKALITGMIDSLDVDVVDGVPVLATGKAPVDGTPDEALTIDIGGSPPGGNGRGIGTNPPGPVVICGAGAVLTGIANSSDRTRTDSMIVAMLITKSCKEWIRLQPLVDRPGGYWGHLLFYDPS